MDDTYLQDLLNRAKCGDKLALENLLDRLRGSLIGKIRRWGVPDLHQPDAIEDTQDKVRQDFPNFRGNHIGAFRLWVNSTAWTIARKILRDCNREILSDNPDDLGYHAPVDFEAFASMQEDLQKALDTLSRVQADVWVLFDVEGYTLQETIKITGLKIKKTKNALYTARRTIQDWLIIHSLVIDIHLSPSEPKRGHQVAVGIELHNYGYHDADQVVLYLNVGQKSLGHQTVSIPVNSTAQVYDFSNWTRRTSPQVVTVECCVGREKRQKIVVVAS